MGLKILSKILFLDLCIIYLAYIQHSPITSDISTSDYTENSSGCSAKRRERVPRSITSSASFVTRKNVVYKYSFSNLYWVWPAKPTSFWVHSLLFLFKELLFPQNFMISHINIRKSLVEIYVFGDFPFLWGLQKWLYLCAELSSQSYRCPIVMSHTWRARSFQMHMQTSRINLSYWSRESFWLQRKKNKLQPSEHYHANWFQFRLTAVVFYHIQVHSHVCKIGCTFLEVFDLTQGARTGSASCADFHSVWSVYVLKPCIQLWHYREL